MDQQEVIGLQFGVLFGLPEAGEVEVVCLDLDAMLVSQEVLPPIFQCFHDGQQFPVTDLTVPLCLC